MPAEVRFAADGMLLSLGRWLRLLGYDCLMQPGRPSRAVLERAVAEGRIFLTRNARLRERLPHALLERACVEQVVAERLSEQLREVVERFGLDTERFVFTRCLVCNEPLQRCDERFWRCPCCQKTFWHGSHVTNSLARLREWLTRR
ncbi:MAG: Mut7-C RNAse domain-containing protein [Verrucomicrobiae bacterium]|nr:Mut7-C RNAse domain-containing protein [Verrucomicrobiae bacterium]